MSAQIHNRQINIASIVLAGGKGTRLFPLTMKHCKPAVSYGGRYKLIDIPISNSLNSNIRQIYVIGQYLTTELQHHLSQTYQFDSFFPGSLDLLTPEELPNGEKIWFEGTADAIRKNAAKIFKAPLDYFLILSGDQLYNINFHEMLTFAISLNADLTIASLPVPSSDATRMGLLKIDEKSLVTDFYEKPQEKEILDQFKIPENFFAKWNLPKTSGSHLGSMGIYIFKREALEKLLSEKGDDFGKHLIPIQLKKGKTAAFVYNGYWEDIGTIESYYKANMALTSVSADGLKTYDEQNPIYTRTNHLPGTKIKDTLLSSSIICEGGVIQAKEIANSVIGLRANIKKGTTIQESILMGNNFYTCPAHQDLPEKFEIGENCLIKKTIIDEHVLIGNNVKLINKSNLRDYDSNNLYIRDGVIVIPAGVAIPDNFEL
jgi:glucose-1-phosphate adenylyltransferase